MNYEPMFNAAIKSLAELSVALEIPPEVAECANGNAEMLEAIAALKARRGNDADWLWGQFMDWCKKMGTAPAQHNELFAIVGRLRERQLSGAGGLESERG